MKRNYEKRHELRRRFCENAATHESTYDYHVFWSNKRISEVKQNKDEAKILSHPISDFLS